MRGLNGVKNVPLRKSEMRVDLGYVSILQLQEVELKLEFVIFGYVQTS
jgi:hypothetical protein